MWLKTKQNNLVKQALIADLRFKIMFTLELSRNCFDNQNIWCSISNQFKLTMYNLCG